MHNANPSPKIEGTEITLFPFEEEHISDRYIAWLNTPSNVEYSELRHNPHTHESCRAYFNGMIRNKHYFWAIFHNGSGNHIGNFSAYLDHHNKLANLAIMIGEKSYKGKGYGLAAWQLVSEYLLNTLMFRKITAGTMSINTPMLKIIEHSGMHHEAVLRKHFLWKEQPVDLVLAAKFKMT